MHVVVIGAGVAGASVAYFLARAGTAVTVVDAGVHAASHVPSALVNPVRGQSGQVDARAPEGLRFTWALVQALEGQGHAVPHDRAGVVRPVPDDRTRMKFERNLPPDLPHAWLQAGERPAALRPGWAHALHLPGGGWLDGQALCSALLAAAGAPVVRGRARAWTAQSVTVDRPGQAALTLEAGAVVWCGGSVGLTWAGEEGTHRMGTLLTLDRAMGAVPLSFGAYVAPATRGGVLGATFEAPSPVWREPEVPLASLRWLLDKGEALGELRGLEVTGRWTGSRLSGLRWGRGPDGVWRLAGLGSKGFLLGPVLAAELVQMLLPAGNT